MLLQIFSTSVRSVSLLMLSSFPSFKISQKSFPLLFALSVHVDVFTSLGWSTVFFFDLNKSFRMDVSPIRSVILEELLVWVELDATSSFVETQGDGEVYSLPLKGSEELVKLVLLSSNGVMHLWGRCPEFDDGYLSVGDILLFMRSVPQWAWTSEGSGLPILFFFNGFLWSSTSGVGTWTWGLGGEFEFGWALFEVGFRLDVEDGGEVGGFGSTLGLGKVFSVRFWSSGLFWL